MYFLSLLFFFVCLLPEFGHSSWTANYDKEHDALRVDDDGINKKLVFLAGPHSSAHKSVERFIANFHGPFHQGHPRYRSMQYWRWGGDNSHVLVTNPDSNDAKEVSENIKTMFQEDNINGIIVGSRMFDQVGPNASYDAITAMTKLAKDLNVEPKNVVVILNYRTPRVEQWISMWKHVEGEYSNLSYKEWMCDTHKIQTEHELRLDMIGSWMNPMNAAYNFLQEGYDVKLIDLGGVDASNQSITHVVVTQILLGAAGDGKIAHHQSIDPHHNVGEKEFNEFEKEEYQWAEKLFRFRDCDYINKLKPYIPSGQLEFLYRQLGVWESCDKRNYEYYKELASNSEVLYSALLHQLGCKEYPTYVDPNSVVSSSSSSSSSSKTTTKHSNNNEDDLAMDKYAPGEESVFLEEEEEEVPSTSFELWVFRILAFLCVCYYVKSKCSTKPTAVKKNDNEERVSLVEQGKGA